MGNGFLMRGGKREGAGRPAAPERPKPVSWRPDTQAQRDKFLRLGGAAWIRQMIDKAEINITNPL